MAYSKVQLGVEVHGDSTSAQAAMRKLQGATAANLAHWKRTGREMKAMGSEMTRAITLPIVAIGAASTKMAMDFQESMDKIVGLVGVSRGQVEQWSQQILKLGGVLPQSPKELADALFFVTSAGFKGKAAMDVLTASARAAAAGLGDTKTVADAVTSAVNAYGIQNLSAAQATDVLVQTVKSGKMPAQDLASALGKVLPVAAAAGVSFDQVGASIASMTRLGLNSAEATTAVRGLLMAASIKISKGAADELKKIGLSAQGLRQEIRDKGLLSTLLDLQHRTHGNADEMAKIIPNARALTGALSLVGKNAKQNAQIQYDLAHSAGATDKAFKAWSETSKAKLDRALSGVKASMIELGTQIMPIVAQGAQMLAGYVRQLSDSFNQLSPSAQHTVLVIAGIAAAAGPVVYILGSMITLASGAATAVAALGSAIAAVVLRAAMAVPALEGIGLAIAGTNPLILGIVGIAAVAGIAYMAFKSHTDDLTVSMEDLQAAVQGANTAIAAFRGDSLSVKEAASGINLAKDSLHGLQQQLRQTKPGTQQHAQLMHQVAAATLSVQRAQLTYSEALKKYRHDVKSATDSTNTQIKQLSTLKAHYQSVSEDMDTAKKGMMDGGRAGLYSKNQYKALGDELRQTSGKIRTLEASLRGARVHVKGVGADATSAQGPLHGLLGSVTRASNTKFSGVQVDSSQFFAKLGSMAGRVAGLAQQMHPGAVNAGRSVSDGVASGIAMGIGNAVAAAEAMAAAVVTASKRHLKTGSPSRVMRDEVGLPIAQGLAIGITMGQPLVSDSMDNVLSVVSASSRSVHHAVHVAHAGIGFRIALGIASGITKGRGVVGKAAEKLLAHLQAHLQHITDKFDLKGAFLDLLFAHSGDKSISALRKMRANALAEYKALAADLRKHGKHMSQEMRIQILQQMAGLLRGATDFTKQIFDLKHPNGTGGKVTTTATPITPPVNMLQGTGDEYGLTLATGAKPGTLQIVQNFTGQPDQFAASRAAAFQFQTAGLAFA